MGPLTPQVTMNRLLAMPTMSQILIARPKCLQVPNFAEEGQRALGAFREWVDQHGGATWQVEAENYEGWRVAVDEGEGRRGWLLLRASLHDPLLVLNCESDTRGGALPPFVAKRTGLYACLSIGRATQSSTPISACLFLGRSLFSTQHTPQTLCSSTADRH